MFRTIIRLLDAIGEAAFNLADRITALETAWEKKKPALENKIIDISLDLEEAVILAVDAIAWTAKGAMKGITWTANKTFTASRCTYKAIKKGLGFALPIMRRKAMDATMKLKTAFTAIYGKLAPVALDAKRAWAFREALVIEARS